MSNALLSFGQTPDAGETAEAQATTAPVPTSASQPATSRTTAWAAAAAPDAQPWGVQEKAALVTGSSLAVAIALVAIFRPLTFSLAAAPPRENQLSPLHPALTLLLWLAIMALTTFVAALCLGISPSALSTLAENDESKHKLSLQVSMIVAVPSGLALLAASLYAGAGAFTGGLRGMGLSLRHWRGDILRAAGAYIVVYPVCLGLLVAAKYLLEPWGLNKTHAILEALLQLGTPWRILGIFAAAVLAPLAEELYFRGLVQSVLRKWVGRPWLAILLASVFFAVVHPLNTIPSIFVLSLALGFLYERTGRLTPCILLHCIFNSVSLAMQLTAT